MTKTWVRWLPAGVVPVVIVAAAIVMPMQASAATQLEHKTPEQLLSMVTNSSVRSFSGTIEQKSDLGLPELPSGLSSAKSANSVIELLTGTHTARVYVDGATKVRVQVLDSLAERDVIRNGSDVWLYDSAKNAVTHVALPAHAAPGTSGQSATPSPNDLAKQLLAKVDPSTKVSVGADRTVAGRSAYDLVLTPRASDTLVGSVSIAVDSKTGLPLGVWVEARGDKTPAFDVHFSSLTIGAPDAKLFAFTPPTGAKVTEQSHKHCTKHHGMTHKNTGKPSVTKPTVTGTGWDAVATITMTANQAKSFDSPLLSGVTTKVAGGRLISTTLVNVLLTDDGRVLAGSVPAAKLEAVAAGH